MNKLTCVLLTSVLLYMLGVLAAQDAQPVTELAPLQVSPDRHCLVKSDGTPFFWLADTGWCLFSRTRSDVNYYLDDRGRKRFSVIQMMAIRTDPRSGSLWRSGPGDLPFSKLDPVELNEAYWQHIDYIVDQAAKHGLYVVLFSMWGRDIDRVFPDPAIDLPEYGRLIARRYRDRHHVLWSVCGEYEKINDQWKKDATIDAGQKKLIRALAHGIDAGRAACNLMTIHPIFTSARDFHNDDWLDFNMQQTWGHIRPDVTRIGEDYRRRPTKPVLNGEPGYENRPEGDCPAWHLRLEAYWSVFSGGFGFTYGAHKVWQFDPGWKETLDLPGARQMRYLRALMESRPPRDRVPDAKIITSSAGSLNKNSPTRIAATQARNGDFAFVYTPQGNPIRLDMSKLSGKTAKVWWYSPRDGTCHDESGGTTSRSFGQYPTRGTRTFTPPGRRGTGHDWVLVLDNAARQFAAPGT